MATRRSNCTWCGAMLLVRPEMQTVWCPVCRGSTNFVPSNIIPYNRAAPIISRVGNIISQVRSNPNPPPAHGPRRAVLCGVSYKGSKKSLDGSINDVMWMKNLLTKRFGFPTSSVIVLTEEESPHLIPTKKNIRAALRWLVQGCRSGDSLVFHYSGHGAQVRDHDGDEVDGHDESIVPVDYETEGRIIDDEINVTIVRPLTQGATLHAIIDTCFSGTLLDLPNVCSINGQGYFKWEDHNTPRPNVAYKGTSGGFAISIGACADHQNSGDTTAFTGTSTGALTYSFVQILEYDPRITYGRLLIALHKKIGDARLGVGLNNNESHLAQEPQLASSHKFDIHSKPFTF